MQGDAHAIELLRGADLRVTRPRLSVLAAVRAHPHADTDALFGAVRRTLPDVSRQAVYDVLAALTTAGLIRRIQPSGSVARYESRVGDVDCAIGSVPCLTPADDNGFVIDEAEVIYWGQCPDCASSAAEDSTSTTISTTISPTK